MAEQIEIIDVDFGLSQLSGNRELLITLLGKFKTEYQDLAQTLNQYHQQQDSQAMKQAVHTVKGVSGNLGLKALHKEAKELESAIINGLSYERELHQFRLTLAQTFSQIDELAKPAAVSSSSAGQAQPDQQIAPRQELNEMLKRNEFIAPDRLDQLLQQSDLPEPVKRQLSDAINDLDYPQALQILARQP